MKRLTILLLGPSQLLSALGVELSTVGHHCVAFPGPITSLPAEPLDLVIDDGSSLLASPLRRDLGSALYWTLAVDLNPLDAMGLPVPALLVTAQGTGRLLYSEARIAHEGNGLALHQGALRQWTDELVDRIGELSRDSEAFDALDDSPQPPPGSQGLLAFDALAYRHRGNQTADPGLLAMADQPLTLRLERCFTEHAARVALQCNGTVWTYAQLRAAAEPVRHYVMALDAQSPAVVGVCMAKRPELFACVLGILLAGAVYLPLEPSHPIERRRFILENSGARALFQAADQLAPPGPWEVVDPLGLGPVAISGVTPSLAPDSPCMALYTSGTTGRPKGVLLSQRNLSHFTAWYGTYTQLSETSRVLQFSTLSFDSATIDLFPTWLAGATLVVPTEDERRDPTLLTDLIARAQVDQAFLPPAMLSLLPLDRLASLRCIATGGDVCEPWVVDALAGRCRFLNLYGPTEATVLVTASPFQPGRSNRLLGWPIANSEVWLLDENRRPVLDGETGEVYIVGPGVALGYINDPQQTSARYLQLQLPGGSVRAFRTGDTARWSAEGLHLVGRLDNQVKIRGFRVEPEEIEGCLRDARVCEQVAVVIDERRRILAFVARAFDPSRSIEHGLREYVAQRLPTYMQPVAYVELSTLPAVPSGKVDRAALRALAIPRQEAAVTEPLTAMQVRLQALWAELLELEPHEISTTDSFFDLGGHSILLSRMLLSLRERFHRSVSINRFIELPTLERLEALLEAEEGAGGTIIDPKAFDDAVRTLDLTPLPMSQLGDVHKVLVTGANSFVGVHIVAALLDWGATEVTCLVRPNASASAEARFATALVDNRLDVDMSRVRVLAADLTRPRLGLDKTNYNYLDEQYGSVIHNAANVNHVLDYGSLARDNVEPLFELLAFCEGRSKKILNFVSTLSACSAVDNSGAVLETGPALTPPIYIRNGYNVSKWVGERILARAEDAGCFVNIFRPGNISFNSQTGVCQPHKNRLMLMLKGSLQLAAVPALELNFDLMPVDFLAKVIAFQASRHDPAAAVFNLHNPKPLSWTDYVASFASTGHGFDLVPVATWQQRLGEVTRENALYDVLGFYLNGFEEDIGDISAIHHNHAAAVVANMGASYPAKDAPLLARGCAYLQSIGFI